MSLLARIAAFAQDLARRFDPPAAQASANPYRGGEVNRLNKNWQPDSYSGDSALNLNWELLSRRIRDLERNDPAIKALNRTLVDHVIATGIQTLASVIVDDELVDDFCDESDDYFEQWAERECDYYGKLSWPDMQRQAFREVLETGEVLLLKVADNSADRLVPLCYQVLEAEQLDHQKDQEAAQGKNQIRRGIEVNKAGRPIAYWLFDTHPDDYHGFGYAQTSRRIPADRVLHLMSPGRPSATRGVSNHSAITQTARDLDNYLGAELTAANIAALFTLVHKTGTPGAGFGFVGDGTDSTPGADDYGNATVKLGRGIVSQIGRDDSVESIQANRPNGEAKVFVDLILMLMGMGVGVSKYRMTRNYASTTYISARAAHQDDKKGFVPLQQYIGRQLCLPVHHEFTRQVAAFGLFSSLTATQFRRQQRRWQRVTLLPPGWEQLDPRDENDADVTALNAGTETLEAICARRGRHWRRVLRQRKREKAYMEKIGLELTPPPPAPGQQPADSRGRREENAAGTGGQN